VKPVLIATLVALALAAGGGGAYLWLSSGGSTEELVAQPSPTAAASPTSASPTPTASPNGWATYRDPELGFSFPYPEHLTPRDESEPGDKTGDAAAKVLTLRDESGVAGLGLVVNPNATSRSLRDWIAEYDPCISQQDGTDALEAITIAGRSGFRCPFNTLGEPNPKVYVEAATVIMVLGANVSGSGEGGVFTPPVLTQADFQRVIEGFTLPP